VDKYFDPNDSNFIGWSYIAQARGWVDPVRKEYNLLLPTGTAVVNDIWIVYDLVRRKWFEKAVGTADFPQCGFNVMATTGEKMNYGGIETGVMIRHENGTTWNGTGITQTVKTGDFFPSDNIWDETTLRKLKLLTKKITQVSSTNTLNITYYQNTAEDSGIGVIFQDADAASGIDVNFANDDISWAAAGSSTLDMSQDIGLQRLLKLNSDLNRTGWAHAFEFSLTTDDVTKGFSPVAWGVRYRIERKDDTAS
jgi:hypothetical protein